MPQYKINQPMTKLKRRLNVQRQSKPLISDAERNSIQIVTQILLQIRSVDDQFDEQPPDLHIKMLRHTFKFYNIFQNSHWNRELCLTIVNESDMVLKINRVRKKSSQAHVSFINLIF